MISRAAVTLLRHFLAVFAAIVLAMPASNATPQPGRANTHLTLAPDALQRLYGAEQNALLWSTTGQAQQALDLLRSAPEHGLDPAHYAVDTLTSRLAAMTPADAPSVDRELSQAVLQFLADLHFGRVTPDFQLDNPEERLKQFDAVEHLRKAHAQQTVAEAGDSAAPPNPLYKRVKATLQQYRQLAAVAPAWSAPPGWPRDGKLKRGTAYPGLAALRQHLALLGDLDADQAAVDADFYNDALASGLKRFQARHSLAETGLPGPDTVAALSVPLAQRVRQLGLTLERLRWLPPIRQGRVIVVNVAAYRLWAFDTAAGPTGEPLEMRVIVGKAARTQTPLFIGQMRYLEFNPYWNVPRSIAVGEIVPKLARNPGYLAQNHMELVSQAGKVQGNAGAAAGLRSGALRVRQRPGAHNVLGAVKFAMPNPMNIYLHSTSAKELFVKPRRDLSHGCIRVERPAELASFVLGDQAQWTPDTIAAAMVPGATKTVRLSEDIPVVLFYATAATDRTGRALFADDIYKRDDKLARALTVP